MVVACFVRTISKTGSKRVNDELHKCALPRMKTGLLEFIDATVNRFFMRLRTSCKCRTDNIRTEGVNEEITIPYTF